MFTREDWLKKAEELKPVLRKEQVNPIGFDRAVLAEGESLIFDYGNHYTGHLKLKLGFEGCHPDAPLWLQIRFAENLREFDEDIHAYQGWISKGWIQSEEMHIDVLPCEILLPRRYAFRYVKIAVIAASSKYRMTVDEAVCVAESSADEKNLREYACDDPQLKKIDAVSARTLHECMQEVFEDGPKRDRRLWLGDLRIQALVNSVTYQNHDLVKRCLYLFAGCANQDGSLPAAVFIAPRCEADDVRMFDYSLLYIRALLEYFEASQDEETLRDLWPLAKKQIECAEAQFDGDIVRDSDVLGWCFIDWDLNLNKQASAQGVYLYALKAAVKIAEVLNDTTAAEEYQSLYERRTRAAFDRFFDRDAGLFVSGDKKQLSAASQIWMTLGADMKDEDAAALLKRIKHSDLVQPVTPYLTHYYLEALMKRGQKDEVLGIIREYWGGMVREGADTFWELYDPENPDVSPYGGTIVNSYCHAWSCGPSYFLRNYFGK